MDDFNFTYFERHLPFIEGAQEGKMSAEKHQMEDIIIQAEQFGIEFAQQLGIYSAYLQVFDHLKIQQQMPLLKVNDIANEMKSIVKAIDYSSLPLLKEQREELRKKFQIFKAMMGIKKSGFMAGQKKYHQQDYDF